jgi:4-hydroxybenzoate polyprenyltransferase
MQMMQFKSLSPFYLAALSLLGTGFVLNPNKEILELVFLAWICISGIYLVYRFNDFIDQTAGFKFDYKKFLANKVRFFFSFQLLLLIPFALVHLSLFRFIILSLAAVAGFLYSYKVDFKQIHFRLKHIFLLKNMLIGFGWGGLLLVGANQLNSVSFLYFLFSSLQVFIGSTIRDISDIDKDRNDGVHSMPVVLGSIETLRILKLINGFIFLSLFILWFVDLGIRFLILPLALTSLWRSLVIFQISNSTDLRWQQKWNLWTCNILFLGTITTWILTQ